VYEAFPAAASDTLLCAMAAVISRREERKVREEKIKLG
jgi:hypothetical protein